MWIILWCVKTHRNIHCGGIKIKININMHAFILLHFLLHHRKYKNTKIPMKGVNNFGVRGKLAARYISPFPITERCGSVAYRLKLPKQLAAVHNVFHIS
jgi:hypothetical protein